MLLDTVALLRWLQGAQHLGPSLKNLLRTGAATAPVHVSVASIWDVAIKVATGKLAAPPDFPQRVTSFPEFAILPIDVAHAWRVRTLPLFADHKDPFDRLIAAQALAENLTLVSPDPHFARYGVPVVW